MQPTLFLNPTNVSREYKGKQMTCANCNRQDIYYEDGYTYLTYRRVDGEWHWTPYWFCSYTCILIVNPEGTA